MELLLALAALIALSLFFASLPGVKGAAAPFLSVCATMCFFSLAGVLDVLRMGGILFYVGAFALGVYAFVKRGRLTLVRRLCVPGFFIFIGVALGLLLYLGIRQPVFSAWDEFSFWGSAAKIMKQEDALHISNAANTLWPSTERPGFPALSYFAQFFGTFAPWKTYWAYDILLVSGAVALTSPFAPKQWRGWLPLAAVGLALPFCYTVHYATTSFSNTWLSAYADVPAGIIFGGALAVYFMLRAQGGPAALAALPLAALCFTKENLLAVALVAAGVMAADGLLFGAGWGKRRAAQKKPDEKPALRRAKLVGRKAAGFAGWFCVPLGINLLWQRYSAYVAYTLLGWQDLNPESVEGSVGSVVAQVLGLVPKHERFWPVLGEMADQFLGRVPTADGYQYGFHKMSMLGSGLVNMLVIVGVFALAVALLGGRRAKLRAALCGGLLLAGFWAFQFGLFTVYVAFNRADYQTVFDYERYLSTYFAGWLMAGLWFLARAAAAAQWPAKLARAAQLALACVLAWQSGVMLRPGYTVLDYPDTVYAQRHAVSGTAAAMAAAIGEGEGIFFICQNGDGSEWYEYAYNLLPKRLDYSLRGGAEIAPSEAYPRLNPDGVADYIEEHGLRHAIVLDVDEGFREGYGFLFADGLSSYAGGPALYRMNAAGLYEQMDY